MGTDKNRFHFSLTPTGKVTTQCLEEKRELKRESNRCRPLTSLTLYRWAKAAHSLSHTVVRTIWLRQRSPRELVKKTTTGPHAEFQEDVEASILYFLRWMNDLNQRSSKHVVKLKRKDCSKKRCHLVCFHSMQHLSPQQVSCWDSKKSLVGARNGEQNKN